MKRVQIIIPTLDQSGAEKQFSLIAAGIPRDEFDVHVLALNRGGPFEEFLRQQGVPYQILQKRGRFDLRNLMQVRKQIQTFKPDVVLSALFSANSAARLATIGLKDRPALYVSERCVDSWKSGWQLKLDKALIPRTDRLIANSQSVKEFYEGIGVPSAKITTIPNGVAVPPLPAMSREQFLRDLQIPLDAKLVMCIGRVAPQKGIQNLIWATHLLKQPDPRTHFLIIGDGPQREELQVYASRFDTPQVVKFLGHRRDAASLLHFADAYWQGSRFEGMSNSLMEAMAIGVPVVVSDIPPNRELVTHDKTGWIISKEDPIGYSQFTLKIFEQPENASAIGQAAATLMKEEFSIEKMIARYTALLRN